MKKAGTLLALVIATGCSSSSGAGGVLGLSGTFNGGPLTLNDVGGLASTGGTTSGPQSFAEVFATSGGPACGWFDGANSSRANLTTLALLVTISATGSTAPPPVAATTYFIGPNSMQAFASASVSASDANCQDMMGTTDANEGTITFTSITSDALQGSFDITFSSGDELKGSFDAPVCTDMVVAGDAGACHP